MFNSLINTCQGLEPSQIQWEWINHLRKNSMKLIFFFLRDHFLTGYGSHARYKPAKYTVMQYSQYQLLRYWCLVKRTDVYLGSTFRSFDDCGWRIQENYLLPPRVPVKIKNIFSNYISFCLILFSFLSYHINEKNWIESWVPKGRSWDTKVGYFVSFVSVTLFLLCPGQKVFWTLIFEFHSKNSKTWDIKI